MGFVVLHMEKAHGSDSGTTAHIERFIIDTRSPAEHTSVPRILLMLHCYRCF